MKNKIFVYPIVPKKLNETGNPYTDDLIRALENNDFVVINKLDDRRHGVLSLFNYLFSTDYFYFNWIENLPQKKLGFIQTFIFFFQFIFLKFAGKKVIWTLHNFNSHYSDSSLYLLIRNLMIKYSDIIIIHSSESIGFLKEKRADFSKILQFFHPFSQKNISEKTLSTIGTAFKYDILIWGAMNSYKGILEFVRFYSENNLNYSVLIAGRFKDPVYYEEVRKHSSESISIINSFVPDEEVIKYHSESKFVLFPYNGNSILNSGALAFSLSQHANIIGPKVGAFKELGDLHLISTFEHFSEIIDILQAETPNRTNEVNTFLNKYSWNSFGAELKKKLASQK